MCRAQTAEQFEEKEMAMNIAFANRLTFCTIFERPGFHIKSGSYLHGLIRAIISGM
jgi:hypothetical protein